MASSDTTRLLVLGVAQIFGPANGYQLRRELLSWDVQEWANINPGSIYSMLSTLTKQGMVERADIVATPGAAPVAVYRATAAGSDELRALVRAGLTTVHPFERTYFYAAASLMVTTLERAEIITLIDSRIDSLAAKNAELASATEAIRVDQGTPPHVARLMDYSITLNAAEADWLRDFAKDIANGKMTFLGEPDMQDWKPADNDPAWRMVRERELYLQKMKDSTS